MRILYRFLNLSIVFFIVYACGSSPLKDNLKENEKPVVIANDSLEYEIIIFDVGFTLYLNTIARPKGYYSQNFLENRNSIYVTNWNLRAQNPSQYDASIYGNVIDYNPQINYGLEVNYQLFNYFLFAQQKYNMRLDGGKGPLVRIR